MEFDFPKLEWKPEIFDRLLKAIAKADFDFDFDSNDLAEGQWFAVPDDNVVPHDLGVIPKQVIVYSATDAEGTGMLVDTWTAIDSNSITITGSAAYCRVLLNK